MALVGEREGTRKRERKCKRKRKRKHKRERLANCSEWLFGLGTNCVK